MCPRSLDPFYTVPNLRYKMGQDFLEIYKTSDVDPHSIKKLYFFKSETKKVAYLKGLYTDLK